jgi:DNA adenine methylase
MPKTFFRWAGGKTWLSPFLANIYKFSNSKIYVEPFLGGGSSFFRIKPERSYLNDVNSRLISVFKRLQQDPIRLYDCLSNFALEKEAYYQIRSEIFDDIWLEAAQFIYLNRMCFGGLHRVNLSGKFNVPFGNKKNLGPLVNRENFIMMAECLSTAELTNLDFEIVIKRLNEKSFIYADPVYTATARDRFDRYNELRFGMEDHIRLAESIKASADENKSIGLVSLPFDDFFLDIYKGGFWICFLRSGRYGFSKKSHASHAELIWITGISDDIILRCIKIVNQSKIGEFRLIGYSRNGLKKSIYKQWGTRIYDP